MAKTKTRRGKRHSTSSSKSKDILHSTTTPLIQSTKSIMTQPSKSVEQLLEEASELLERGEPETALPLAEEALRRLEQQRQQDGNPEQEQNELESLMQQAMEGKATLPQALSLTADIELAMGDAGQAQRYFLKAVKIDPDGELVSAEPYLWLAQLSEQGGKESIMYYNRATLILRNEIELLEEEESLSAEGGQDTLDARKAKLADALCAMAEVYMTDLSWEDEAEEECEQLVRDAVEVCPERLSAGCLQVLASVRISQERMEEAKDVLRRSMAVWRDVAVEGEELQGQTDERIPDFATRVSLCRLLMEVEEENQAMGVLEGLVKEDDQSVECWYLGGWCQILFAQKQQEKEAAGQQFQKAKEWLDMCLQLYKKLDYEDERLKEHAEQLAADIRQQLDLAADEEEDWEDEEEEMIDDEDEVEINGHDLEEDGDVEMG